MLLNLELSFISVFKKFFFFLELRYSRWRNLRSLSLKWGSLLPFDCFNLFFFLRLKSKEQSMVPCVIWTISQNRLGTNHPNVVWVLMKIFTFVFLYIKLLQIIIWIWTNIFLKISKSLKIVINRKVYIQNSTFNP